MIEHFPINQEKVASARAGWPADLAHKIDDSNGHSCLSPDGTHGNYVWNAKTVNQKKSSSANNCGR